MILTERVILRDEVRLREVLECLRHGGVMVFPTETIYSIGGALSSRKATEKIFSLKARDASKPLLSIAFDLRQAEAFTQFRYELEYDLYRKLGDRGLTVVLDARPFVSSEARAGLPLLGIRLASTELTRTLTERLAEPLSSTSASFSNNLVYDERSGDIVPRDFGEVPEYLVREVDIAIDGGPLPDHEPSTVVRVLDEHTVAIKREGSVPKEDLLALGVHIEMSSSTLE